MDTIDQFIFKRPPEEYNINLTPVKDYIDQASFFISRVHDISIEEAKQFVRKEIKKTATNPIVKYNYRNDKGDSSVEQTTLTDYIQSSLDNNEVIVPSFTTYVHPSVRKSLHAEFLDINIKRRKKHKNDAFKYKQLGDKDKQLYNDVMQKTLKIFNNSLSGAYASKSTILYNPSEHYTLTSITRSVASIGNAISESIIAGNKHLRSPEITINYIAAVASSTKVNSVDNAVKRYGLYIPTVDDVIGMLKYSTKWYWEDEQAYSTIRTFLTKLTPYELVNVMYTNDLWHMMKYNNDFVKGMLTELSRRVTTGSIDPINDLNKSAEGVANLAHNICYSDIKGKKIDYAELEGTELLTILGSTARNITVTLNKYKLLFRTFFASDLLPPSISYIRDMMRDAIVLSDTDSTCASYDKWVDWYFGAPKFTDEAIALASVVMTITTQAMDHNLKIFARNMNVESKLTELIKMKNEYYWSVFTAANVSKHYYASTIIQEGNVFAKPDLELKGVHLIASAIDQNIVKLTTDMETEINTKVTNGEKLSLHKYITEVANVERDIINRIKSGDINIYKKDKIKEAGSYKLEKEKSPYRHHMLWEEVFAEKYGTPGDPTYMIVRIPTTLDTVPRLKEYIENIEDADIRTKLGEFLKKYNMVTLGTYRPPISIVSGRGIPKEIIDAIDVRRIVEESCNALYIILETLGFYRKDSLLISEMGY